MCSHITTKSKDCSNQVSVYNDSCALWNCVILCHGTLDGGRRRGRQMKCYVDNIEVETSLPVPELLTLASRKKRLEEDLCWILSHVSSTTEFVRGQNWTVVSSSTRQPRKKQKKEKMCVIAAHFRAESPWWCLTIIESRVWSLCTQRPGMSAPCFTMYFCQVTCHFNYVLCKIQGAWTRKKPLNVRALEIKHSYFN